MMFSYPCTQQLLGKNPLANIFTLFFHNRARWPGYNTVQNILQKNNQPSEYRCIDVTDRQTTDELRNVRLKTV